MSDWCGLPPGKVLIKGPGFLFSHIKEKEAGLLKWEQLSPKHSSVPPPLSLTWGVLPVP